MDYHSMKRAKLQALCKKHSIPANSANSVLADKLSELLNIQEKPKPRGRQRTCIKSPAETIDESESAVSRRQSKKVRFSPEVEYERSAKKQEAVVTELKVKRKSVAKKVDEPIVDSDDSVKSIDDVVQIPVRQTRSRPQVSETNDVIPTNEEKRGRRAVKDVEKETDVEKASESVKEPVIGRVRVTRSKAQPSVEDNMDPDLGPQVKKKHGRPMAKDAEVVEPSKETMDIPVRSTRSRGQKSNDDNVVANPQAAKKRTRGDTKVADPSQTLTNEDEGEKLGRGRRKKRSEESITEVSESQPHADKGSRQSRRNNAKKEESIAEVSESEPHADKGLRQSRRNNAKKEENIAEVSESQHDAEKGTRQSRRTKANVEESIAEVPESQHDDNKGARQSRRNKAKVEDSTVLNQNASEVEMGNGMKATRSKATKGRIAQQIEEPLEHAGKKIVNHRKSVMQPKITEEPLEHAGKKIVNRRKSVMQPKITEVVEEHVVLPAKKDTRRKSVVEKALGSKKPTVETRKTVGRKQSKDASENETKAEASASGSHKSRKRKEDPIIEDQAIETESASKNEVKPTSRKGETSKANSSKKRAKLSGTKETDSEDHAEKSHIVSTPVSKMGNLELDENINETEPTPAIDESARQSTRGRKKSSQSAIKETEPTPVIDESARQLTRGRKKSSQSAIKETEPTPAIDEKINETEPSQSAIKETEPTPVINESARQSTRARKKSSQSAIKETEPTPAIDEKINETEPSQSAIKETEPTPVIDESARHSTRGRKKSSQSAIKEIEPTPAIDEKINETEPSQSAVKETEPTLVIDESARHSTHGRKKSSQSAIKETEPTPAIDEKINETEPSQSAIKETEPTPVIDESARQSTRGRKKSSQSAIKETEPTPALDEKINDTEPSQSAIKETEPSRSAIKETDSTPAIGEKINKIEPSQSAIKETEPTPAIDEKINETEPTPAIDESARQFTRGRKKRSQSAIKETEPNSAIDESARRSTRGRKEPILSAIKDVPFSSRKGAKSRTQPAVNATQGRVTRSGIKAYGMASLEDSEVKPSEDVSSSRVGKTKSSRKKKTSPFPSEEQLGDPSASESECLPTKVIEEINISITESAIVMEHASPVSGEDASEARTNEILNDSETLEKADTEAAEDETNETPYTTEDLLSRKPQSPVDLPHVEDETPSGTDLSDIKRTPFSMAEAAETTIDAPAQIQEVDVPEVSEKEMEFTETGTTSKVLETDGMVEVSAVKAVVIEESVEVSIGGADSSAVFHASFGQSTVESYSKEIEAPLEPSTVEGVQQFIADIEASTQIEKGDDEDEMAGGSDVADNDEDEMANTQNEPISEDNVVHGTMDEVQSPEMGARVDAPEIDSLMKEDDVPKKDDTLEAPAKEAEFFVGPSTGNDVCGILVLGKSDGEDDALSGGHGGEDEGVNADKNDDFNMTSEVEPISEPSTTDHILISNLKSPAGNEVPGTPMISKDDLEEDDNKKLQFSSLPSNIKSIFDDGQDEVPEQVPAPRNDDSVIDEQEVGDDRPEPSVPKNNSDGEDDGTDESEQERLISKDVGDDRQGTSNATDILDEDDKSDGQHGKSEQEQSTAMDEQGSGYGAEPSNVKNICDDEDDRSHGHEHFTTDDGSAIDEHDVVGNESQPSNADEDYQSHGQEGLTTNVESSMDEPGPSSNAKDTLVDYESDGQDEDSEHEDLITKDSSAMDVQISGDDEPKPAQNENVPSSDQKPESMMSHLFEEVSYDTIDASTSKTSATTTKSIAIIQDINLDSASYDTKNDSINEQKIVGEGELDEGVSSDLNNEQKTEETELAAENPTTEESSPLVLTEEQRDIIQNFASIPFSVNEQTSTRTFEQRTEETELTTETQITEQSSEILYTKEEITDQLLGDTGAHETPIKEELLDRPTSSKDTNINHQDTSIFGLSDSDPFGLDDFQKPDSANRTSDDLFDESPKDDQVQDLQTSAVPDGQSSHKVANVSEDFFSWTDDSSLKALLKTPAATRVKDGQARAVSFGDEDELPGIATQNLKFDFTRDYFDDEDMDQTKQQAFSSKAAGPSYHDASGFKDKESEEKDEGRREM